MPESSTTVARYEFPEKQPQFFSRLTLREYYRPFAGSGIKEPETKGYIRLPLPSQLNDAYNMNVNGQALGVLGNISGDMSETANRMLAAGQGATDAFVNAYNSGNKQTITNLTFGTIALSPGVSDLVGGKLGALIGRANIGNLAQAQAGVIRNPHITSLFDGVQLKTFQFTWRLSPKSEPEAKKMNQMINYIKQFMHPAILKNSGGFALEYPYIARLQFEGLPSEVTPTVGDSFITSMGIESSTGGGAVMYRDGQPVHVDIQLSFQEINIRTREDFGGSEGRNVDDFMNNGSSSSHYKRDNT
jgi:hypothetical protein